MRMEAADRKVRSGVQCVLDAAFVRVEMKIGERFRCTY